MQMFGRGVQMTGPVGEVVTQALALREHVSGKIGAEVALWNIMFGAPAGSMAYTVRVNGIAGVQAMGAALVGDAKYDELLAKGSHLVAGPPIDTLRQQLNGDMGTTPPPVGSVATVSTAIIAAGKYAQAIAWGMEVAAHVESVTGMPVGFLMDMFGPFGRVVWIGIASDAASADTANDQLNADAGYMAKLGEAGGLFVDGMSQRSLAVRIG